MVARDERTTEQKLLHIEDEFERGKIWGALVIAALFIDPKGHYTTDQRCDCWPESRDARAYTGPLAVVAHPPCAAWSKLAGLREWRYGLPRGEDGGCFAHALACVRAFGGVLEHPEGSAAWPAFGLPKPPFGRWLRFCWGWVTELWQVAYGHRARKKTWLFYAGQNAPAPMLWLKLPHTAVVSGSRNHCKRPVNDRNRVWGPEARRTPPAFAEALIQLALNCGGPS